MKNFTIHSMNQAVKSVVRTMSPNSEEYSMVQSLCATAVDENVTNSVAGKWATFQQLLVKVTSFNFSTETTSMQIILCK